MTQLAMSISPYRYWEITTKCDPACLALADRHYSRQKVGTAQFTRPHGNGKGQDGYSNLSFNSLAQPYGR